MALPLYAVLGEGATFLLQHDVVGIRLAVFAMLVYAAPAAAGLLLWLIARRLGPGIGAATLTLVVSLLLGCWALGVLSEQAPALAIMAAVTVAGFAAWGHWKRPRLAEFLRLLGLASVIAPLYFLFLILVMTQNG